MVESRINLDDRLLELTADTGHGGCAGCGTGKALASQVKCGNGLEKIYPTTAVRFGYMRYIGEFTHAQDMRFTCGAKVVIQTKRGIELGEQVSLTCHGCDKSVTRDQMRAWVDTCGSESFVFDAGRILREATAADLAEHTHIQSGNRERRDFCQQLSVHHDLPMRVAESETLLGGERIIFYFTAEERIDFRDIVKELAREYRTRIEMRQIGARDEARLLADYETCGREVCCKVFLKTLRPISMRMAKLQKATLDPSQVSGRCGRLKCCLRYEHVGYEELDKRLPRNGIRIRTSHGDGVVVNRQVLTQLVQIRKDDDTLLTVVAEDIAEVNVPPPAPGDPSTARESATGRSRPQRRDGRGGRDYRPRHTKNEPPRHTTDAPGPDDRDESVAPHATPDATPDATPGGAAAADSGPSTGREPLKGRRGRRPRRGRGRRHRRPPGGPQSG